MTAPTFPLGGAVAIVGSRHGSPYRPDSFAAAVVAAGGSVVTGCARGVDHAAATAAAAAMQRVHAHPASLRVFRAAGHTPADLAARTRQVIHAAAAVAVFPPSGPLGPGSALALRLAQSRRVPVFFAGPTAPAAPGPWSPATVAGVSGWLWSPPTMPGLF
nr:Hypothetical protein [synthetic construct]